MSTKKNSNPFLSQANFPRLWTLFQYFAGGAVDKRKLCKVYYGNQTNILEIGCSTGITAKAFLKNKNINYTGIDLDNAAIKYAKNAFKEKNNFNFIASDLRDFVKKTTKKFDYILFAGVIHHIDNSMAIKLSIAAAKILSKNGILVVVEPLLPEKNDPKFMHYYKILEQGKYVRTKKDMLKLVESLPGLRLEDMTIQYINATPFNFPICAKHGIYRLKKSTKEI